MEAKGIGMLTVSNHAPAFRSDETFLIESMHVLFD
jgi:hypothetical protein